VDVSRSHVRQTPILNYRRPAIAVKSSVKNFAQALIAVLAGNIVYFLLMPRLPVRARHVPLRLDLGLVVDFFFCLVVFGMIKTIAGDRETSKLDKS